VKCPGRASEPGGTQNPRFERMEVKGDANLSRGGKKEGYGKRIKHGDEEERGGERPASMRQIRSPRGNW